MKFLFCQRILILYQLIVDVARLKVELEQFSRMLRLKWRFRNDKIDIPIDPLKTKSAFNSRNRNAAIKIYLSSLEVKLLKIEVPKDKFNNLTKGEWDALDNLKNDKNFVIKGAVKGWAVVIWDREHYIKEENKFGDTNIYEEISKDNKPCTKIILKTLRNIRKSRMFVLTLETISWLGVLHLPGFIFFQKFIKNFT